MKNLFCTLLLLFLGINLFSQQVPWVNTIFKSNTLIDGNADTTQLFYPYRIVDDGMGNAYFTDSKNHAIRKVNLGTGDVTTIAGNGMKGFVDDTGSDARFDNPRGICISGNGQFLYVGDGGDNLAVRQVEIATGAVVNLAGGNGRGENDGHGSVASFNYLNDMVMHGDSIYIAEGGGGDNNKTNNVRLLDLSDTTVSTFYMYDNPSYGTRSVKNLALSSDGDTLWLGVVHNHGSFTRVIVSTMQDSIWDIDAKQNGIALAGPGRLYYIDDNGSSLREIDLYTASPSSSNVTSLNDAFGLTYNADSAKAWVTLCQRNQLQSVDILAGTSTPLSGGGFADGPTGVARIGYDAIDMAYDTVNKCLYIADPDNFTIRKLDVETTEVTTIAGDGNSAISDGNGTSASFRNPRYIAMNHDSMEVYVVEFGDTYNFQSKLRAIDLNTMEVTTIAGNGGTQTSDCPLANSKLSYTIDGIGYSKGIIYLVDHNNKLVRELDLTKDSMFVHSYDDNDYGRVSMYNDTVYFYDNKNLKYFDPVSETVTDLGAYFSINDPNQPFEIDTAGYVYSRVTGDQNIYKTDIANTTSMLVAGNGQGFTDGIGNMARFDNVIDIEYSLDSGLFYLIDKNNQAIRRIYYGPGNTAPSFTPGGSITQPEDTGSISVTWATNISEGTNPEEEGQQLTFVINVDKPSMFTTLPSIDTNGVLLYEVAPDSNGIINCEVQLQDNAGTFGGGVDTSGWEAFSITVEPVNDAPSFTPGTNKNYCDNEGPVSETWASDISVGPANESNQTPSFSVSNDNNALFTTQPVIDATGTLSLEPADGQSGTAVVSVQLMDDGGTANGGVDSTSTIQFNIQIDDCVGMKEIAGQDVSVYPNPASEIIEIDGANEGMVRILNVLGNVIIERNIYSSHEQINIASLPEGVYLIEVYNGDAEMSDILIVK